MHLPMRTTAFGAYKWRVQQIGMVRSSASVNDQGNKLICRGKGKDMLEGSRLERPVFSPKATGRGGGPLPSLFVYLSFSFDFSCWAWHQGEAYLQFINPAAEPCVPDVLGVMCVGQ